MTPPRRPNLVPFALLSAWTLLGPIAILIVGAGGSNRRWPPDRPVEWIVFVGVTAGFALLFALTLIAAFRGRAR